MSATADFSEEPVKTCRRGHSLTPDNLAGNGVGKPKVCKKCRAVSGKAWALANPEKAKAQQRRSSEKFRRKQGMQPGHRNERKTHCPEGHEYTDENTYRYKGARQCRICRAVMVRKDYWRHRDARLALSKRWREDNLELARGISRRWRLENREYSRMLDTIKRQRRRAAGTLTAADWKLVLDVYGRSCLACGKPEVTIDHVIPISKGGPNVIGNVQPLCGYCNMSKGVKTIDYRPAPWADVEERAERAA